METKIKMDEARFYSQLSIFKDSRDVVSLMESVQRAVKDHEHYFRDDPEGWKEAKDFVERWFSVLCQDI